MSIRHKQKVNQYRNRRSNTHTHTHTVTHSRTLPHPLKFGQCDARATAIMHMPNGSWPRMIIGARARRERVNNNNKARASPRASQTQKPYTTVV